MPMAIPLEHKTRTSLLYSSFYTVEFDEGKIRQYAENIIAEYIYVQARE